MDPVTYRRILLPLDASVMAEVAIGHGLSHALAHGAAIHLVQVVDPVDATPHNLVERFRMLSRPPEMTDVLAEWRDTAQDYLQSVAEQLREAGVSEVTFRVLEGNAYDLIAEEANEAGCDLIVIATHGRSGLSRAVMGSVADRIVRFTPNAAVLVIRPPSTERDW